ncbi:MAG: YggS family pyridoxal phosphate-dependent enzyme [Solirubrobacterales bacterium]|nr:YggS family pyridoxal phosphate-dependent enzyme [Solirubrobacterales bacterium]HRV60855.1 YggS family pyridoxal phosphate-dependent enzyme [Solirubrobacterales bacterium]
MSQEPQTGATDPADAERIRTNIATVRERMATACERAGRDPDSVRLLLATKTVEPERIRVAIEAGEKLVAENRVQEVRPKFEALADLEYERHFIGHLQSNKVNALVPYVSCIETLDRLSLARKLNNRLEREGETLEVLIQVNTSGEETKAGLEPDEVEPFIRTVAGLKALKIRGLMTIGLNAEPEVARPSLALLRETAERIREENIDGVAMDELSMGMTGDLEVAIEEGSTIVRVGSAIFGARD